MPEIVIIGGGFAGMYAARQLRQARAHITLIDRRNHHLFQPLLYQVATAGLSAPDIASPLRKVLKQQKNTTVLLAEAQRIDTHNKRVILDHDEISYDYLVVATGATHDYFGHDDWAQYARGLKSLDDALEIRRRILLAYEHAESEPDPQVQEDWLNFVVVGAGPTGVELAGALAEIAQHTLARDFRRHDPRQARVLLLDAADRVLPAYPPNLSAKAQKQLESLGVECRLGTMVTHIDSRGVQAGDHFIPARTVLWAAGVAASPLGATLQVPRDRAGRILVNPDLSVPGAPEVFVAGDLAAIEQDGAWVPGVAPAAIQQGKHAAENIRAALRGRATRPFRYRDKGSLATIGRSAAVAHIGQLKFSGFLAWWAWLVIHIFFLIGFRNRFAVLLDWAWAYVTLQRSARIILEKGPHPHADKPSPQDSLEASG